MLKSPKTYRPVLDPWIAERGVCQGKTNETTISGCLTKKCCCFGFGTQHYQHITKSRWGSLDFAGVVGMGASKQFGKGSLVNIKPRLALQTCTQQAFQAAVLKHWCQPPINKLLLGTSTSTMLAKKHIPTRTWRVASPQVQDWPC